MKQPDWGEEKDASRSSTPAPGEAGIRIAYWFRTRNGRGVSTTIPEMKVPVHGRKRIFLAAPGMPFFTPPPTNHPCSSNQLCSFPFFFLLTSRTFFPSFWRSRQLVSDVRAVNSQSSPKPRWAKGEPASETIEGAICRSIWR